MNCKYQAEFSPVANHERTGSCERVKKARGNAGSTIAERAFRSREPRSTVVAPENPIQVDYVEVFAGLPEDSKRETPVPRVARNRGARRSRKIQLGC